MGAYGGRKDIMEMVAPAGPMYQAGTLSGNPLAMTAGIKVGVARTVSGHDSVVFASRGTYIYTREYRLVFLSSHSCYWYLVLAE